MDKLSVYDFGERLISSLDIDPVYVLLWEAKLEEEYLKRWLLAYWCFYHVGTASWITDGDIGYWKRFEQAAGSKEYPRCHERRHFRGDKAVQATLSLRELGLSKIWFPLLSEPEASLATIMAKVQELPQFGPWISFKVADMLERLELVKITFDDGAMFLFDSPREGAVMMYDEEFPEIEGPTPEDLQFPYPSHYRQSRPKEWETAICKWAVKRLVSYFSSTLAPPGMERFVNCQEAETILCKWKSYRKGHYHLGEDVQGCRKGLLRFAKCELSQELLRAGRKGGLWK